MKQNKKIRSAVAVAMLARYGAVNPVMKDRRLPRGGAKNKVNQILKDWG
jgi:hypothetical protein